MANEPAWSIQGRVKKNPRTSVVVAAFTDSGVRVLQAAIHGADRGDILVIQKWGAAACNSDPDQRARALSAAISEAGIRDRRVALCLPSQSLALRRVHLPPAAPEQLPQLVAYEAQRHLPLPLDQLATGYQPLKPLPGRKDDVPGIDVLVAVARKSELARLERALAIERITVEGYGVDVLAVTDAYLPIAEPVSNGSAQLVLAPDAAGTHVQLLAGRHLLFNRYLSMGSQFGDGPSAVPHAASIQDAGTMTDLRRTLTSLTLDHPEWHVEEVIFLGDGDENRIATELGLPVRRAALNPEQLGGLDVPPDAQALVGLARQWLGLGQYPLRLPAQGWEESGRRQDRSRMMATVVIAVAAMAGLVWWQLDRQSRAAREGQMAAGESRAARELEKQIKTAEKRRDQLRDQLATMGGAGRQAAPLDLLREVSARAPAGVWLTQVTYQAGKPLQIQGTARSSSEVTSLYHRLEHTPSFGRVDLGFLRSADIDKIPVTHFRIDCALSDRLPADVTSVGTASRMARRAEVAARGGK